jgi:hypothetical protein
MGRPKKVVDEKVESVEPKKRGRKKKVEEEDTIIEDITQVDENEFKIEEEVKEITTQIDEMKIEEETEREEKRMEKLNRRYQLMQINENKEEENDIEKVYYLYMYPCEVRGDTPEDSFYKQYMKSMYQIFFYKRYLNYCYMDEIERKDIEYEDEWELIKNKQRCIVRKMKNPPDMEEYKRDEWIQWLFQYRKMEDIKNVKDIYQKILGREEYFIQTKEKKERWCIDNSFLLERMILKRNGEMLEESGWKVKDIFEKMIE